MKFYLLLLSISLSLLSGCQDQPDNLQSQRDTYYKEKKQEETNTSQIIPKLNDEIIKQGIKNYEANKQYIIPQLLKCKDTTETYSKEYICTDTIYVSYNAINPSITEDRTYLYKQEDISNIQRVYQSMLKESL